MSSSYFSARREDFSEKLAFFSSFKKCATGEGRDSVSSEAQTKVHRFETMWLNRKRCLESKELLHGWKEMSLDGKVGCGAHH